MRKFLTLLAVLGLSISMIGCGGDDEKKDGDKDKDKKEEKKTD